jgi:putative hemolysin
MVRLSTQSALSDPSARPYRLWLAANASERSAAQRLRYQVFHLELGQGSAQADDMDQDDFDAVCDHLLVEHQASGQIIGTYRLQSGSTAAQHHGYYSEQEFDFAPFEPIRASMIELGRACVLRSHRNLRVLGLLWQGIGAYAVARGANYLCGCSSLMSCDAAAGLALYQMLATEHLVAAPFRTEPLPAFCCQPDENSSALPALPTLPALPATPKLLKAYLSLGAKLCGPPAHDRDFKTIDFLTLMDLSSLSAANRARFLG